MSVADKLHQRQMALRKKSGLPHPDYYKELGHSYGISDDKERLAKQAEIKKKYKVEEVEQLDEMPESSMKTRDVHAHLKKSGWELKRTGGGHDVYAHPKSDKHIAVPRHKQLKAPLIRGIMKASRVSEETEIDEQLEKKGRFVSGPVKKPFKSSTIVSPIKEAKDPREYDYEGDMAMSQLRSLMFNAQDLIDMMEEDTNLPEWVQSKITLAEDYISTAANYLRGELNEAANPAQQAAIAINMKKKGIKPKKEEVEQIEEKVLERLFQTVHNSGKNEYVVNSSVHQHPDEKHYNTNTLIHKGTINNKKFEASVHVNRGVEFHTKHSPEEKKSIIQHFDRNKYLSKHNKAMTNEEVEQLDEKNVPTNPELWSRAKALARSKFDVYPSAYANGWASKWYKSKGGGWKTVSEDVDDPSAAARTLSRKAQIVKDAAKGKKQEQEQASDKFQKDPELSSDMQKT